MRRFSALVFALLAAGCAAGPEVSRDESAVYGTVTARAHKALLAKWERTEEGPYGAAQGMVVDLPDGAIDYGRLSGIHVGLIDAGYAGGTTHDVSISDVGARPDSLAVAVGDVIRVRNATAGSLTAFLAATEGEGFQELSTIAPGAAAQVRVEIEGLLELGVDENDRVAVPVMSRRGLRSVRVESGGNYVFNRLAPGAYRMTFWYWRLGSVERSVKLAAGTATRVDEVLSVDRTVR
jgi:hypothetical protein